MLLIGLTGGIGSGKSTVAELFARLGAGVVDTDLLARELTEPGTATLAQIADELGADILNPDGSLDRARLRGRVFADPAARARLESILHPPIRDLMLKRAAALKALYVILVIPLLFETGQQALVDRVLVVDCPESVQIARVQGRSGLPEAAIAQIMASQVPRAERLARADDIIDNQGAPDTLPPQVRRLHRRYLALAGSGSTDSR
ncbi:MAG: dephospho-CoA kinase [Bdellovibrio bacteriovorus]